MMFEIIIGNVVILGSLHDLCILMLDWQTKEYAMST